MAALLAVVSALFWGVADFVGGLASRRSTPWQTLVLTTPAGLVAILPLAFLVSGTATGSAAYVGMALAVVAIVTVGLEPTSPTDDSAHQKVAPRALLLAIGAGAGIGLFFAFLSFAPSDAGLWPVVFARGTSTVLLVTIGVVVAFRSGQPVMPTVGRVRVQAVWAGILDVAANGFYVLALQIGLLSVVAVLGSLYPAATVLLARLVLAERLRPMQKVGMVTALVASALLALG